MKGIALVPIVVSLTGCGCTDMAGSEYTVSPVVATPCCANVRTAVVDRTCCKTVVVARPVVNKRCCPTCYDDTCY